MLKKIKFINLILIITLATVSLSVFNKKVIVVKKHHYKCYQYQENNEQEIKYSYYFDIYTDEFDTVTSNQYTEEFSYKNKEYYESAKSFYEENYKSYKVISNDNKQIIKIKSEMKLDKDTKKYTNFVERNVPSSFVCEELL